MKSSPLAQPPHQTAPPHTVDTQARRSPLKLSGLCVLLCSFTDHDQEILRQNKRHTFPFIAKFFLLVIQKVPKIYMKQLSKIRNYILVQHADIDDPDLKLWSPRGHCKSRYLPVILHHDVAVVPVSDAQDKGCHAVPSAGAGEQVNGRIVSTARKHTPHVCCGNGVAGARLGKYGWHFSLTSGKK